MLDEECATAYRFKREVAAVLGGMRRPFSALLRNRPSVGYRVFPVLTTYVVANWSSQQTSAEKTFRFLIGNLSHFRIRLPEPAATIFATAAFTGLRRGEIRGLRWENYCDGEIRVTQ
jgi:integrase